MSSTSTTLHTSSFVPTSHSFFTTTEFFTTFFSTDISKETTTYGLTNVTQSMTSEKATQEITELSTQTTTPQVQLETGTPPVYTTNVSFTSEPTEKETVVTELTVTSDTLELTSESSLKTEKYLTTLPTTPVSDSELEATRPDVSATEFEGTTPVYTTEHIEPRSGIITRPTKESTVKIPSDTSTTQSEVTEKVEATDGTGFPVTTEQSDTSTTSEMDCSKTTCLNGGTCYFTMSGPKVINKLIKHINKCVHVYAYLSMLYIRGPQPIACGTMACQKVNEIQLFLLIAFSVY